MSVCIVKPYVLQQWVMGGEGGRREEFESVQLFSMPRIKKKNPQNHFVLRNQNLENEIFNKIAWLTRNQLEKLQKLHKITQNL